MKRLYVLWGVLVVVLVAVNLAIVAKERLLATGETVLLELAPRDPRSLLQGDYMVLRYRIAGDVRGAGARDTVGNGQIVVALNDDRIARFGRIYEGQQALGPNELLLAYRQRGAVVRLGSDAFFFPEGQRKTFQPARFGELKVGPQGEAVLVGLRDEGLRRLGAGQ